MFGGSHRCLRSLARTKPCEAEPLRVVPSHVPARLAVGFGLRRLTWARTSRAVHPIVGSPASPVGRVRPSSSIRSSSRLLRRVAKASRHASAPRKAGRALLRERPRTLARVLRAPHLHRDKHQQGASCAVGC
jgi:hypothetical protein